MLTRRLRRRPSIGSMCRVRWDSCMLTQTCISSLQHYAQQTQHAGLMVAQRRKRWANVSPALGQSLVFAGAASFFCAIEAWCCRLWLYANAVVDTYRHKQNGQQQTNMSPYLCLQRRHYYCFNMIYIASGELKIK